MEYIKKITINSYRGINSLELNNLSQINIITGDNNCGKTSVLEVLESFRQPDDILMWNTLTRRDVLSSGRGGMSLYEGISDLFNINSDEKKIEYVLETEDNILKLEAVAHESIEEVSGKLYANLCGYYVPEEQREDLEQQTHEVTKLLFEAVLNGKRIIREKIYDVQRYTFRGVRIAKRNKELSKNIIYISPVRHAMGTVFLSEVLNTPDLYEEMLMVLKAYDENIISINYDKDNENARGEGVYKILSKSHCKALPLNVYGDGMKKAILLMSAVIKAKNGILLLDEFETAIHTSAMDKTFRWILETCKKLNVQVFMTTHSKEAIDKVLKCSTDLLNDITVYTMYKDDEEISVRRLDAQKAIEVQDEMGLELR